MIRWSKPPAVFDPGSPVNIYDLGLVCTIEISDEGDVAVAMSLLRPGCPVAGEMPAGSRRRSPQSRRAGVNVDVVWEPQWGMDMMSDEARLELGFV